MAGFPDPATRADRQVSLPRPHASNGSGGSTLDTAYDITLMADGGRVEVWRSSGGGDATLLLSATPTHAFAGTQHGWLAYAGNMVRVDDIDFRYPDPVLETFAYNDANELTSQVVNGVTTSFTYDDWGRMVTKTQGGYTAAYRYRYGDKLKRIDTNFPGESALPVDFLYDGLGRRRLVALDMGNVSWHRYDLGWNVLGDYAAGGGSWGVGARVNSYQWHGMTPLAETPGANPGTGAARHHLHDHLGSTRALFDGGKARLARLDYEPHGQPSRAPGAAANRSFTGKQYDAAIGLYHFPYRHYSPSHARWMTRDPLGMVDGPNVYAYVRGGAVTLTDPMGLAICVYSIPRHTMVCLGNGDHPYFPPNDKFHSGNNSDCDCMDNPWETDKPDHGPIPRGIYDIGPPFESRGKIRRRLTPDPLPRFAFQIHDCAVPGSNKCSQGCITSDRDTIGDLYDVLNALPEDILIVVPW